MRTLFSSLLAVAVLGSGTHAHAGDITETALQQLSKGAAPAVDVCLTPSAPKPLPIPYPTKASGAPTSDGQTATGRMKLDGSRPMVVGGVPVVFIDLGMMGVSSCVPTKGEPGAQYVEPGKNVVVALINSAEAFASKADKKLGAAETKALRRAIAAIKKAGRKVGVKLVRELSSHAKKLSRALGLGAKSKSGKAPKKATKKPGKSKPPKGSKLEKAKPREKKRAPGKSKSKQQD